MPVGPHYWRKFDLLLKIRPLTQHPQRNFEVKVLYTQSGQTGSDFNVLAANILLGIHKNGGPGNILVFLPGVAEINRVYQMAQKYSEGLDLFTLYSTMPRGEQSRALNSTGPNRKCILTTNIAETSLTIENVGYVVDTGFSKQMVYNPRLALHMLQLRQISQASANQRKGRAGRTRDGVCYRLYSKEDYNNMPVSTAPAIRSTSISSAVLKLLVSGETKVADFDWLEAPPPEALGRAALELLNW